MEEALVAGFSALGGMLAALLGFLKLVLPRLNHSNPDSPADWQAILFTLRTVSTTLDKNMEKHTELLRDLVTAQAVHTAEAHARHQALLGMLERGGGKE